MIFLKLKSSNLKIQMRTKRKLTTKKLIFYEKYKIYTIETSGLLVGSRGMIKTFLVLSLEKNSFRKKVLFEISILTILFLSFLIFFFYFNIFNIFLKY